MSPRRRDFIFASADRAGSWKNYRDETNCNVEFLQRGLKEGKAGLKGFLWEKFWIKKTDNKFAEIFHISETGEKKIFSGKILI